MHVTICQSVTVHPDATFDVVRGGLTHMPIELVPQEYELPLLIESPVTETPPGDHTLTITTSGAATGSQKTSGKVPAGSPGLRFAFMSKMRVTSPGTATIEVTLGSATAEVHVTFVKASKA